MCWFGLEAWATMDTVANCQFKKLQGSCDHLHGTSSCRGTRHGQFACGRIQQNESGTEWYTVHTKRHWHDCRQEWVWHSRGGQDLGGSQCDYSSVSCKRYSSLGVNLFRPIVGPAGIQYCEMTTITHTRIRCGSRCALAENGCRTSRQSPS
jgi:hypothetical protein